MVKAGGGLTIGSDPADEVEEAKLKVGPKNVALPQTLATYCNYIIHDIVICHIYSIRNRVRATGRSKQDLHETGATGSL